MKPLDKAETMELPVIERPIYPKSGEKAIAIEAALTAEIALERMVDALGIQGVLGALAEICGLKADHIRSNWQDESEAQNWEAIVPFIHQATIVAKTRGLQ